MAKVYWSEWSTCSNFCTIAVASLYLNKIEIAEICKYGKDKYSVNSLIGEIDYNGIASWNAVVSHLERLGFPIPEEYEDSES